MKRAFALYGGRTSFDLTFRLIRETSEAGSEWKVGAFLGLSAANRIVPFGIAVTTGTDRAAYLEVFRMFFEAVGGKPEVIVTDEERAVHAALVELQEIGEFRGHHLYDSYHVLHNVYKKLANKAEIHYYARILHAKNRAEQAQAISVA